MKDKISQEMDLFLDMKLIQKEVLYVVFIPLILNGDASELLKLCHRIFDEIQFYYLEEHAVTELGF